MVDLWWVSWALLAAALLGGGAWLGLGLWWWFKKRQISRIEKLPLTATFMDKAPLFHEKTEKIIESHCQSLTTETAILNPVNLMWRPPPRASLLHRQQVKTKSADRLESLRARIAPPLRSHLPTTTATMIAPQPKLASPINSLDVKIGRKRQGLESLVTVTPHQETQHNDEPRTS